MILFQNCSRNSQYEGDSVAGIPLGEENSSSLSSFEGVRVLNAESYMNCFEDHVQIGGVCNTGNSEKNYIRYWMTLNGERVGWGNPAQVTPVLELTSSQCENGRWSAVVPKPYHPILISGAGFIEFDVHFQMHLLAPGSAGYVAGTKAPSFTVLIQQAQACGGGG